MTMQPLSSLPACPACKKGHLHPAVRLREFQPNGRLVRVELLTSQCDHCQVQTTRATQHDENLKRLAARKAEYGDVLMGEEIVRLRKRYGLTQQAAAKIFGKGKVAFSRYETETFYPDATTTRLLQLAIEKPVDMKWLADKAGVTLPLWSERCEDEKRDKVRPFVVLSKPFPKEKLHHQSFTSRATLAADNDAFAFAS